MKPLRNPNILLAGSLGVLAALAAPTMAADEKPKPEKQGDNIVLGKVAAFDTAPNYQYCTDTDDPKQLTDSLSITGPDAHPPLDGGVMWAQPGTVGWGGKSPIVISFDLGKIQPIEGVSFSTAARTAAGVEWPVTIQVFISDDNKAWRFVGDLVPLVDKAKLPNTDYRTFRFETHDFHTHGRYVKVVPTTDSVCIFCDEIEVFRGADALLKQEPTGQVIEGSTDADISKFAAARVH